MAHDRLVGRDFGRYRVEAVIGRGGMGIVYRARDKKLDRVVALKVLTEERAAEASFRERFLRESRLLASIDHPNIVPVYEADEADGDLYIAMRFVQGPELRQIIERDGPLPPRRAVAIIAQIADALDAAHAAGLIHRDIKPANILIVSGPSADHAYLTDFGLTKLAGGSTGLTQAGQFVGTPGYVAPEQIQGKGVDHRSDIYALGCVLYDCLTGLVPYPRDSTMASLWAHVHEPPPKPSAQRPGLPAAFDAVIAKALAKDPAERYQTAGGLAQAARKGIPRVEAPPTEVAALAGASVGEESVTDVADAGDPTAETTTAGVGAEPSTRLALASTRIDPAPVTEVGPPGGPPIRPSAPAPEPRRRRSMPLVASAIVLAILLGGSALAVGTGVVSLAGITGTPVPSRADTAAGKTPVPAFVTPSPLVLTPTPTPTPTATPPPPPPPKPDITGPTGGLIAISSGKSVTTTRSVTVSLSQTPSDPSNVTAMAISSTKTRGATRAYASSFKWTLSGTKAGKKTIYVWFRDSKGNWSGATSDSISFDNAPKPHTGLVYDFTSATDCSNIATYGYIRLQLLPGLATDKDGASTIKIVDLWGGTKHFVIEKGGKIGRITITPRTNFNYGTFLDHFTVRDNYGVAKDGSFKIKVGPCP